MGGSFDLSGITDFLSAGGEVAAKVINAKRGGDQVVTSDRPEIAQEAREDVNLLVSKNTYLIIGAVVVLVLGVFVALRK